MLNPKRKYQITVPVKEYTLTSTVFIIVGLVLCMSYDKGLIVKTLNQNWSTALDHFFMFYTHIGLGGVMAVITVLFLVFRYYYALLFSITLTVSGLISLLCKKLLYNHTPRPLEYLGSESFTHLIPKLDIHHWGSFPSGHTMIAFATATIFVLYTRQKGMGIIAFILAALVGISRVYLLQHFFVDVYVGAIIGMALPTVLHRALRQYHNQLNSNIIKDYVRMRKRAYWIQSRQVIKIVRDLN